MERWFGRIFALVGACLLIGAGFAFDAQRGKGGSETAVGTVVDFEVSRSSSGATYCPVITFKTIGGREIELVSRMCSSPRAYDIGETLEIEYDPYDPENAAYGGFFTRWFVVLVLGGMGLIFGGIGIAAMIFMGRHRPR